VHLPAVPAIAGSICGSGSPRNFRVFRVLFVRLSLRHRQVCFFGICQNDIIKVFSSAGLIPAFGFVLQVLQEIGIFSRCSMMHLQVRTALVTGSSSGIGRAIATRFTREGADVVINGRDEKKVADVVKEIAALGHRALGIRANVGSFAESKAMVERAVAEFGHVDILVCNAGVFHRTPFLQLSEKGGTRC
jgi:hypothetical protein